MQQSEILKQPQKEVPVPPTQRLKEKEALTWFDKLRTVVGDVVRDIGTANQMAANTFDGDSALMHMARGSLTTLVGVGLEKVLDKTLTDAMNGTGDFISRPPIKFTKDTIDQLKALEKKNYRLHYFITHASKDLAVGLIYNGLAFFSRPMLRSAEGKHLLASVAMDAADSWLTKDISYPRDLDAAVTVRDGLTKQRDATVELLIENAKSESPDKLGKQVDLVREKLQVEDKLRGIVTPKDNRLPWQTELRKFIGYSNPATWLGIDMMVGGAVELAKNIRAVQKIRKERGGLEGKKVYMPRQDEKRSYDSRRSFSGKQEYKREKVYYGRSKWDDKQQEEEDRAKLM